MSKKSRRRNTKPSTQQNGQLACNDDGFDFASLPASVRSRVQKDTATIRSLILKTAQNVIEIGQHLQSVHEIIGRENFQAWLRSQFRWSQSTASNYMQAATRFREVKCLEQFQAGALFELARHKSSDAARAEAVERAKQGEIITKPLARLIIRTHSTQPPRPTRTVAFHVVRTLNDIPPKISMISPSEADEIHRLLTELLAEVDKVRNSSSTVAPASATGKRSKSTIKRLANKS